MKAYSLITEETAGGEIMKKVTITILKRAVWLMVVFLVLLLAQAPVQAATNCLMATGEPDSDCDGFSDTEETSPIAGVTTDPLKADLYVILEPLSSNSLMPANPLSTLTSAALSRGLIVHQISGPVSGRRNVTGTQKAVKIVENSFVGSYWGYSPQGNPDSTPDDGASTVYTSKIKSSVTAACSNSKGVLLSSCSDANDSTANTLQGVIDKCIRFTTAHEASHQMNLKYTCDASIGCHYPVITAAGQTTSIMDQTVFYVKGTKGTTWYIGSQFNPADTNYQLR